MAETLSIDFAYQTGSGTDYITALTAYIGRRPCPTDKVEHLVTVLSILRAAVKDMDQHPTLVIDNVSVLFTEPYEASGHRLLRRLQTFAKSMADNRLLTIVLEGSEASLVDFLYQNSAASRLVQYAFEPDIAFEEAVSYVTCLCPQAAVKDVTAVVQLVGGRFIHLQVAARELNASNDLVSLKKTLFGFVTQELRALEIRVPPCATSDLLANATWRVAQALQEAPEQERRLTFSCFEAFLTNVPKPAVKKLQASNLFLISALDAAVTFQSPLVQAYFQRLTAGTWEVRSTAEKENA